MKQAALDLAKSFFESYLENDMERTPPKALSGMEVVEIIWPLNDIFRPHIDRIKTVKYENHCESAANKAIEAFTHKPVADTWEELSPCVWRVLLERHQQMLTVALANHAQGNLRFSFVPEGLPAKAILPGIMLLWLHSMELPFPVEDRSNFELPESAFEGSMKLH